MKAAIRILFLLLFIIGAINGQTKVFKEQNRWGIKESDKVLIPAVYDTIFDFDANGKVCLACFKVKVQSPNKIIKSNNVRLNCVYLNRANQKLVIKVSDNDTCSVFSLNKNTVQQYSDKQSFFTVGAKGKKYLLNKDFKQLTFNGHFDVSPSSDTGYYIFQVIDESETVFTGIMDLNEKEIIPAKYSKIRINPVDSLMIACSSGLRFNAEDDIFDYSGKKIDSYHRHVEMATKNYVIQKLFEPKEHFIIFNPKTKEEKKLQANAVFFFEHSDELLIMIKDDWYVYDLVTNTKKPKQY